MKIIYLIVIIGLVTSFSLISEATAQEVKPAVLPTDITMDYNQYTETITLEWDFNVSENSVCDMKTGFKNDVGEFYFWGKDITLVRKSGFNNDPDITSSIIPCKSEVTFQTTDFFNKERDTFRFFMNFQEIYFNGDTNPLAELKFYYHRNNFHDQINCMVPGKCDIYPTFLQYNIEVDKIVKITVTGGPYNVTPAKEKTIEFFDVLSKVYALTHVSIRIDKTVLPWETSIGCEKKLGVPDNYSLQTKVTDENDGFIYTSNVEFFYKILTDYPFSTINIRCNSGVTYQSLEISPKYIHTIADFDSDGIVDIADMCPMHAETINKFEDTDGCPDDSSSKNIIEVDIDFNKNTKDIFISWDFGNYRKSCHVITQIQLDDVQYHYYGDNTKLTQGWGLENISDDSKIECTGKIKLNFSDFSNVELDNFILLMSFVTQEFQTEHDNLAAISLFYNKNSFPDILSCDVYLNFSQSKKFVDYASGPHKAIKTIAEDLSCVSVQSIVEYPDALSTKQQKKSNGGCADCTPPTLGLDKNFDRVVDDGFSYNGNAVQVEKWYTDFPLINATVGVPNLVEIKVYENTGITNMKWVQFCLGAEERGQPLNFCEVLIEVHLSTNGTTTGIDVQEIVINDKDNLIENDSVTANTYVTQCMNNNPTQECVKVDLDYTYREETFNHMLIVNVVDKARNSQNFHFNEGVNVIGESLNEPLTITLFNKHASQQKDNLWVTYTRADKITDTWVDEFGIEYQRINDVTFDRITPVDSYECKDPTLDKVKVWKRSNCHFRALTEIWNYD